MPDATGHENCCAFRVQQQRFDLTQNSLVFVNTCFAIAFGGIYPLITATFARGVTYEDQVANVTWAIFSCYLVFTVWRQYSTYYIPLQFYSQLPEGFVAEGTTLLITLTLAVIALCAAEKPEFTPLFLFLLIGLNVAKVRQMRRTLLTKKDMTAPALSELAHFRKRLLLYLGVLFAVECVAWSYGQGWNRATYAIIVASVAVIATVVTPMLYRFLFANVTGEPNAYSRCIAAAWQAEL